MLDHDYIGTEHILLGLIREGDGVACVVLDDLGVSLSQVRQAVVRRAAMRDPRLGIEPHARSPGLRYLDEQITTVRRDKQAAIKAQNFDRAVELRDKEEQFLAELNAAEKEQPSGTPIPPVLEELAAARAEIERLTALLRQNGIDPGGASASNRGENDPS